MSCSDQIWPPFPGYTGPNIAFDRASHFEKQEGRGAIGQEKYEVANDLFSKTPFMSDFTMSYDIYRFRAAFIIKWWSLPLGYSVAIAMMKVCEQLELQLIAWHFSLPTWFSRHDEQWEGRRPHLFQLRFQYSSCKKYRMCSVDKTTPRPWGCDRISLNCRGEE